MKPLKILFPASVLLLFAFVYNSTIDYNISPDFNLTIKGTSNVHDWESSVEKLTGTGIYDFAEDGSIHIRKCEVTIPVKSIKSEKGSIMDKKTWKALGADDHPNIQYQLTNFDRVIKSNTGFSATTKGKLTIAGNTQTIIMNIKGKELNSNKIEITGSKALKMTDFGIDPPTALLGTMTTGDDITISFRVVMEGK